MNYKRNISDKLALGYGSKYQLLRMLGWHRNEFNKAICDCIGISGDINWLDFKFNGSEDKELLNFEFIPEINNEWKNYWSCGDFGLNWDAVGITNDGTYILVEAKANIKELESNASGNKKSINKNNQVFLNLIKKYKIERTPEDWNQQCYQLANRIVAVDFLKSKGIKVKLVYILFENGYEFNSSINKSVSSKEWQKQIDKEFNLAGIKNTRLEKLVNVCIFNCNKR